MSREKFSAEDILLGIHFAKREVARTRPDRSEYCEGESFDPFEIGSGLESPSEEYLSARNDLSRWNSRARRFCARREKELEGFPIEFETLKTKKEGSK